LQCPLEAPVERVLRAWLTLALVSVGVYVTALDNSIVNVALPSIQRDLRLGLSATAWVVNGCVLDTPSRSATATA